MDEELESLMKASGLSPDNIPLKLLYIKSLMKHMMYDTAAEQCKLALTYDAENFQVKMFYAVTCFELARYSQCEVLLEEIFNKGGRTPELSMLYVNTLLKLDERDTAAGEYRELIRQNPEMRDEGIEAGLGMVYADGSPAEGGYIARENDEEEAEYDRDFSFEKPDMSFRHVGGMDTVKDQIRKKIILPLEKPEIFKAYGKKAGGGILLFGPPGCGKTYLARATAGEIQSAFISVGLNDVLDMWLGESEKNIARIFELARRNKPCVLFFDEIDALGGRRSGRQNAGSPRTDIHQFLSELDGIRSDNDGILVLGATNMPWAMDAAFRRPGRFDRVIFIPPPDEKARREILEIHCSEKPVENIDYRKIAQKTADFSGADLRGLIDYAVEEKIEESLVKGAVQKITTNDILSALKNVKPTTGEWLATARNHALYSNPDGMYDEVAEYLRLK